MCEGSTKCTQCAAAAAADGSMIEISDETKSQIISSLNAQLYDNNGTEEQINNAYAIAMTYFEYSKITPSAETVISNKDEIETVISDPEKYLSMASTEGAKKAGNNKYKTIEKALKIAVVVFIVYMFYSMLTQNK